MTFDLLNLFTAWFYFMYRQKLSVHLVLNLVPQKIYRYMSVPSSTINQECIEFIVTHLAWLSLSEWLLIFLCLPVEPQSYFKSLFRWLFNRNWFSVCFCTYNLLIRNSEELINSSTQNPRRLSRNDRSEKDVEVERVRQFQGETFQCWGSKGPPSFSL